MLRSMKNTADICPDCLTAKLERTWCWQCNVFHVICPDCQKFMDDEPYDETRQAEFEKSNLSPETEASLLLMLLMKMDRKDQQAALQDLILDLINLDARIEALEKALKDILAITEWTYLEADVTKLKAIRKICKELELPDED